MAPLVWYTTIVGQLVAVASASALLEGSLPIWHDSNLTARYVYFRSPEFVLPAPLASYTSAMLTITAQQSPNVDGQGTSQSKLLGAYKLSVNGVVKTSGPGHSVPMSQQAVNSVDLSTLLRDTPSSNVLAIASYFNSVWAGIVDPALPRIQAVLSLTGPGGAAWNLSTGPAWSAWDATAYHHPDGDNGNGHWYHLPNEDLTAPLRPLGWDNTGFVPGVGWRPAAVQTPFPRPFYLEQAPAPAMLWRTPCNITSILQSNTCGSSVEGGTVALTCRTGTITSILFSSYGTPSGQCTGDGAGNTFSVNSTCNSANSTQVVSTLCLGKSSCSILVDNAQFGPDPCEKTPKRLAVAVACTGNEPGNYTTYSYLVDWGQELMGGLNITFAGTVPAGSTVLMHLGEELVNTTGRVMVPTRADENYTSLWSLAPASASDPLSQLPNAGMYQHEFTQFRYSEVLGSPVPLDADAIRAWTVVHPFEGSGENPFETACARSTPNDPPTPPSAPTHGMFSSSNPGLDAVFNMTAYTAIATSLDINVDSQTRQRDLCHIDALITGHEQFAVFPSGDYAVQRRTFRNAFGNDSGIWGSWTEFKQSGALMPWLDALETGDTSIAADMWSDDDGSITSDTFPLDYNSLQFYSGVRYYDSESGMLSYPMSCGGTWACDPLVDWPTNTRDGYVIPNNTVDAVRNGLGAVTLAALSQVAGWIGKTVASARYASMASSVQAGFLRYMLRYNTSASPPEAYFTDGRGIEHAAVHSTVYGVISGAASGNASLSALLGSFLRRRDVVPSSCMTGRWYVQALYQLGVEDGASADYALQLLSRTAYPGWGYMISRGATTTLEAWAPEDKWNTDWAHPWCAAPAFLIPRYTLGLSPLSPGWSRWRAAPQPGNLTLAALRVPTPAGAMDVQWAQDGEAGSVTLSMGVLPGTAGQVCLPPLHPDLDHTRRAGTAAGDVLSVDGQAVPSSALGRLLCTVSDVGQGVHTVVRTVAM